jgi:hypothetical protein
MANERGEFRNAAIRGYPSSRSAAQLSLQLARYAERMVE